MATVNVRKVDIDGAFAAGTRFSKELTTDAAGDAVFTTPFEVSGRIHTVQYVKDDYVNNVTLSVAGAETAEVFLALAAGVMDASVTMRPRIPVQAAADGSALLYGVGYAQTDYPVVIGEKITLTVAAGGNAKTGTFYITLLPL